VRAVWVVLGVVLLVAGAVLLFVPVVPQGSHTETIAIDSANRGWYQLTENISGVSVTGGIPVSVSWTSSGEVYVDAAGCSHYCDNVSQVANYMQVEAGLSGSISLTQPNGGSIFLAWAQQSEPPTSINFTYSITTGLTVVGPVLLIAGSISLILGIAMRSKDEILRPEAYRLGGVQPDGPGDKQT